MTQEGFPDYNPDQSPKLPIRADWTKPEVYKEGVDWDTLTMPVENYPQFVEVANRTHPGLEGALDREGLKPKKPNLEDSQSEGVGFEELEIEYEQDLDAYYEAMKPGGYYDHSEQKAKGGVYKGRRDTPVICELTKECRYEPGS